MAKVKKKVAKKSSDPTLMSIARDLERGESTELNVPMILTKVRTRRMHSNPDGKILEFEVGDVMGEFPGMPKTRMIVAQG